MVKKNPFWVFHRRSLLGFLFLLTTLISFTIVTLLPSPLMVLSPIYQGPEEPQVAITINVDWGAEYIPSMMEILEDQEVKATFFVTGTFVEKHPHLIKKMVEEGHELGNHGYSHLHPNTLTREEIISLIKDNDDLLLKEAGVKGKFFAPPYGEYNDLLLEVADELGYQVTMWTVDSVDWQRPGPQIIKDRVLNGIEKGSIILIHPIDQTVDVLGEMIKGMKDKGLTPVTLSSLLKE